jgi:hypothetical protein
MYLCHACSCQEILRMETAGQAGPRKAARAGGGHRPCRRPTAAAEAAAAAGQPGAAGGGRWVGAVKVRGGAGCVRGAEARGGARRHEGPGGRRRAAALRRCGERRPATTAGQWVAVHPNTAHGHPIDSVTFFACAGAGLGALAPPPLPHGEPAGQHGRGPRARHGAAAVAGGRGRRRVARPAAAGQPHGAAVRGEILMRP